MIPEDQLRQIKENIISQINSNFPEERKSEAIEKIEAMGQEDLEQFIKQNQIMQESQDSGTAAPAQNQCPFCLINAKQIPTYIIEDIKDAMAVLEINPISKGHVIVIPKEHLEKKKIKKPVFNLAEKVAKKIRSELKPKGVIIEEGRAFNHGILNIIPIYENETVNSPRSQAKKEELEEIQKKLTKKTERKPAVEKINKNKKNPSKEKKRQKIITKKWFPNRIP